MSEVMLNEESDGPESFGVEQENAGALLSSIEPEEVTEPAKPMVSRTGIPTWRLKTVVGAADGVIMMTLGRWSDCSV